jgi:hypothetical protein
VQVTADIVYRTTGLGIKFVAKSKVSLYIIMSNRGITNAKVVDEIIIYLFSCLMRSSTERIEEENKLPNPYKAVQKKIFVRSKKAVIWFFAKKTPVEAKTNNKGIRHRIVSLLSGK